MGAGGSWVAACARRGIWPSAWLPGALHNRLVYAFQLATAHGAEWALQAIGYTTVRQVDTLWIGRREFEVIETCSRLRAAQTLTRAWEKKAAFSACQRLASISTNSIR